MSPVRFPTALHQRVAEMVRDFLLSDERVDTVLLVNSCARGHAVPESDVDVGVLLKSAASSEELQKLEEAWVALMAKQPLVREFRQTGAFSHVHLDVFDGRLAPAVWDDGGGPDAFEVAIGNRVAHPVPLHDAGPRFRELQQHWLPYYSDDLRRGRLAMVRDACAHDLEYIPFCAGRGLYFHAFDRLYKAYQEFLQALFIAQRVYPVAYNKWIREQVAGWLGLPELYRELPPILSVRNLESDEIRKNADTLRALLEAWVQP